ncbi:alpha-hydroxy-acid oxidizing protein [Paraburkholderia sp. Ac-20340]|uniref:alpha-hydroxy acid oxidase n=1 Tax=Paraburkholderia sp. Ac-20340 TaxID=2703888 RepID=UPI001982385A|nr:alpha-hydroxy acid oxidase [Paraburkholderia sp. Ac-20340]MBN3851856.1 alpha-hydroxy-acid oxidizing protein [Paraburkholderia sp. Ac-20340]
MTAAFSLSDYPLANHSAPRTGTSPSIPRRLARVLSLADFEAAARRHLPRPIFAYVSGGCETDRSLRDNRAAFEDYDWVPRVLVDTSRRTLDTTLFGHLYAAPFGIAPMGISALSAYRGDLIQAQASALANVPMIMSGSSLIRMEEIAAANPQAWFQMYVPGEADTIEALVDRVAQAGFGTLVLTADVPVSGNRENNLRAGFSTPLRPGPRLAWDGLTHPRWLFGTALRTLWRHGMPHFENSRTTRGAPILSSSVLRDFGARDHLSWEHLRLIRRRWRGNLVVKGILDPDDARRARELGADGLIVSNHGGRQLDGSIAPLRALPAVVNAVDAACPVMIDSGFRRGGDVLMAIALGARAVFIGRPFNYAGAVAGQAGVLHALAIVAAEMRRNMALLGATRLDALGVENLRPRTLR